MKALGVDPGRVRIGLAVSDDSGMLARPLTILQHVSRAENARRIVAIAVENGCDTIVVGTPLDGDGEVGPSARASLRLIEAIEALTELKVIAWDESGTSVLVHETQLAMNLSRKRRAQAIDDKAAAVILNDYLMNHSNGGQGKANES